MARKRYTAEEIIGQLRTIEIELGNGLAVVDACRKLGITEQTYDRWTAVRHSRAVLSVSERRACRAVGQCRATRFPRLYSQTDTVVGWVENVG